MSSGGYTGEDRMLARQIGEVIIAAVEARGLSIRSVAAEHGLDHSRPSKWRAGSSEPSFDLVAKWAEALGMSPLTVLESAGYGGGAAPSPRDRVAAALHEIPELSPDMREFLLGKMERGEPATVGVADGAKRSRRRV